MNLFVVFQQRENLYGEEREALMTKRRVGREKSEKKDGGRGWKEWKTRVEK